MYENVKVSGELFLRLKSHYNLEISPPPPRITIDESPATFRSSSSSLEKEEAENAPLPTYRTQRSLSRKLEESLDPGGRSLLSSIGRNKSANNLLSAQSSNSNLSGSTCNIDSKSRSRSSLKVPGLINKVLKVSRKSVKSLLSHSSEDSHAKSSPNVSDDLDHESIGLNKSTESIYKSLNRLELTGLSSKLRLFNAKLMDTESELIVLKVELSRKNILEDSICFLTKLEARFARTKFLIKFVEEEGLDFGGVGKEWFHLLSSQIYSPKFGLFVINEQNNQIEINRDSTNFVDVKNFPDDFVF
jgi:hypothetical protein